MNKDSSVLVAGLFAQIELVEVRKKIDKLLAPGGTILVSVKTTVELVNIIRALNDENIKLNERLRKADAQMGPPDSLVFANATYRRVDGNGRRDD